VTDWLQCDCGADVLESDEDGCHWEDDTAICPGCGRECSVTADEDPPRALVSVSVEPIDFGRPLCDGSCGACDRYVAEGHQCRLDCERVPEATRERVRELIARGASEDEIREEMAWLT